MTSPQRPSEGSDTPQQPQQPQQPDWSVLLPREGEPVGPPPVGAAPPGSPTGATPPPQPPRPPRAVPQPSRNGFAIASLILGILGSGFLLGIVFGVVALVQITAKGQRGRGMAIVGILLSVLWIVAAVAAVAIGLYLARDDVAAANNVKVGDCITNIPDASRLGELVATSCANPHKAEVVGVVKLSGSDFPGGQTLSKQGEDACRQAIASYSPGTGDNAGIDLLYLYPTGDSWKLGDRQITCLAAHSGGPQTGSIRGK